MSLPMGIPPKLIRSLDKLHYKVKFMAELLIKKCNEQNIPIIITQTYRTKETQQEYYSWGRTKINPFKKNMTKVTNLDGAKKISRHQTGLAFDICMGIKGKEYDIALLSKVGKIAMDIGLTWGGSWKSFVDPPHFEIPPNKIDSFVLPEEADEMAKATEKEKGYGKMAIENLAKNKIINSPESHLQDLDGYMPSWKAWVILNNIYEALKGDK